MSRSLLLGRLVAIALCIAGAIWVGSRFSPIAPSDSSRLAQPIGKHGGFRSRNEYLYRMQTMFRPTLEANRKSFPGTLGTITGFGAGQVYPQVWLRDSATLIPVSRFYYSREYLTSWLEEHLAHQGSDGQLFDWIAPAPASHFARYAPKARDLNPAPAFMSADKNTVEADQESSAVVAAFQIYQITGDRDWLSKEIAGQRLIERLDAALEYLSNERSDPESGLIVSGFSADWGDVSPIYPDARAIYLDDATPRVVGLYTNCQFYSAAANLSELFDALGRTTRADYWREKAALTKESINRTLWQPDKGFYRMHVVATPALVEGWQDDSDIFAMGGNALAVLYGVADDRQAQNIFDVAEKRRAEAKISTISGSLLPPYPQGFFTHPLMKNEYSYQNGGQWDWLGARFVLAEFERGYSERARRHLVEIARKVAARSKLYEWHTKDGRGRGSWNYAGSAGALGAASFQGLFGVYLKAGKLALKVRLGDLSGQIQLHQPATGSAVRYSYSYDDEKRQIILTYKGTTAGEGSLSILLPKGRTVRTLRVGREERSFSTKSVGEDRYLELTTDWNYHYLEAQLN